jgi:hypothetical protein
MRSDGALPAYEIVTIVRSTGLVPTDLLSTPRVQRATQSYRLRLLENTKLQSSMSSLGRSFIITALRISQMSMPCWLAALMMQMVCLVQLPHQTAHRIFAGERWTTLHGVSADLCQALAPLGEFFAGSKIPRLI